MIVNGTGGSGGIGMTQPSIAMPVPGSLCWNDTTRELLVFDGGGQWVRVYAAPTMSHEMMLLKYPALKQAWDHYQIVLRMCESQERIEE